MAKELVGFAPWHPDHGFDNFAYEGPVAYADLCDELLADVADLNEAEGDDKNKWRAVKVEITKVT